MRESVQVIKFTAVGSILSGMVTYLISVNMQTGWIVFNSPYISNDFAITILGGIFAGFLVALFCEIRRYLNLKNNAEDNIFFQAYYLYQEIFLMRQNITDFLEHTNEVIPKGLLYNRNQRAVCQMNAIRIIDYCSIFRDNDLRKEHNIFCEKELPKVEQVLSGSVYLDIAINMTEKELLKNGRLGQTITSSEPKVHQTLLRLRKRYSEMMKMIEEHLRSIDKCCKGRYCCDKLIENMHSSYVSLFDIETFEDFMAVGEEKETDA